MQAVGEGVKHLAFDLQLPLGPYKLALDHSGRHAALAGASGHLALMDWSRYHLMCETQVKETTHDICILHNEQFFAAAQKKYVYIYDRTGREVHCCQDHHEAVAVDFLRHHFLLASCGKPGTIHSSTEPSSMFHDAVV
jgi:U3 small nucleolar RNA-associated protein 7